MLGAGLSPHKGAHGQRAAHPSAGIEAPSSVQPTHLVSSSDSGAPDNCVWQTLGECPPSSYLSTYPPTFAPTHASSIYPSTPPSPPTRSPSPYPSHTHTHTMRNRSSITGRGLQNSKGVVLPLQKRGGGKYVLAKGGGGGTTSFGAFQHGSLEF